MNAYWVLLLLLMLSTPVSAEALRFAMLAKSTSDHNFVDAWQGCQEQAAKEGNLCDLIGGEGAANGHVQRDVLKKALASGVYDAVAISVTVSEYLADAAAHANIPVLTFDSPFNKDFTHLSQGYIGPDNYAFGEQLAELALIYRPEGGSICIVTVGEDPNLNTRVNAVRNTLSGQGVDASIGKLAGEGGWYEHARCPHMTLGSAEQVESQFGSVLTDIQPDVVISVGHWPVVDPMLYRRIASGIRDLLTSQKIKVLVGVGQLSPAYKALLDEGLVHGLVSIDFTEIGRVTYEQMKQAAGGGQVADATYTHKRLVYPEWLVTNESSKRPSTDPFETQSDMPE